MTMADRRTTSGRNQRHEGTSHAGPVGPHSGRGLDTGARPRRRLGQDRGHRYLRLGLPRFLGRERTAQARAEHGPRDGGPCCEGGRQRCRPGGGRLRDSQPCAVVRRLRRLPGRQRAELSQPQGHRSSPGADLGVRGVPVVRRSNVIALAKGIDPELGALVEPLAVGYHAAARGACSSQDTVLVIGGGPIGQAAFLATRRLGATSVAVSDINPTRRALCAELGAAVIDPSAKPLKESIVDALGAKATLVIDAVGATATLADAMKASAFGARLVLVGMAMPSVELAAFAISTEERTLIGSFCYSRKHFAETAAWGSRALRRASPNWPRARAKGARSWSSPAALPRLRLRGPDGYAEDRPGSCVHRGSQGRCRLSRPGGVPLDRRPHRHPDGEVPGICRQPPQLRYRRPGHPCR